MQLPLVEHLNQPCLRDTILEVRTGKMQKMTGLDIESGINKKIVRGSIQLTKLGLQDDEHDLTFHGGPDKAILGYCSSHYPSWRESYPERSTRFVEGGFGENFVLANMNERNVCIGDKVAVGSSVILQVSLPRTPCFKLNHRFSLKNFAPQTYKSSRTGWYYRVCREGEVKAGDEVVLLDRPYPNWSIERIQEYLHRNTEDLAMNKELAAVEALGAESRSQFQTRVEQAEKKQAEQNLIWTDFKVSERIMETASVVALKLDAVEQDADAEKITAGSHITMKLPNGLTRSYSVVDSESGNSFELGVSLDDKSRGGSKFIHESVHEGTILPVRITRRKFSNASSASNHCIIVGGIGITAFLAFLKRAKRANFNFTLHYAVRSKDRTAFGKRLQDISDHVVFYDKSQGQRMDIGNIITSLPWNSHVYVCGPPRMMEATKLAVEIHGMAEDEVHFEAFQSDIGGDPFEARVVNRDNQVIQVSAQESLLQVLRKAFGDDIASSCEVGNCGTCKVKLRSGRVEHKGTALSSEEKKANMLSCISRGVGTIDIEV